MSTDLSVFDEIAEEIRSALCSRFSDYVSEVEESLRTAIRKDARTDREKELADLVEVSLSDEGRYVISVREDGKDPPPGAVLRSMEFGSFERRPSGTVSKVLKEYDLGR